MLYAEKLENGELVARSMGAVDTIRPGSEAVTNSRATFSILKSAQLCSGTKYLY